MVILVLSAGRVFSGRFGEEKILRRPKEETLKERAGPVDGGGLLCNSGEEHSLQTPDRP